MARGERLPGRFAAPGPGRPRSEHADRAILGATLELAGEAGLPGLTVDAIAERAGVSKATLYRRWPSKVHLIVDAFGLLPELPSPDQGDLESDLRTLLEAFLGIVRNNRLAGILPSLTAERAREPALAAVLDPAVRARRRPILEVFRRAIARGEARADLDAELAADLLMGPLLTRLFFTGAPTGDAFVADLARTLAGALRRVDGER